MEPNTCSPRRESACQIAPDRPHAARMLTASSTDVLPQLFVPTSRLMRPRPSIENRWNARKFSIVIARSTGATVARESAQRPEERTGDREASMRTTAYKERAFVACVAVRGAFRGRSFAVAP